MLVRVSARPDAYIDVSHPSGWLPKFLRQLAGEAGLESLRREIAPAASPGDFAARILQKLGVTIDCESRALDGVPRRGRVLIVANHPFGALDGLVVIALLRAVRPDLKVLANRDLCALRELAPSLLPIEISGAARPLRNAHAMRGALQWLEQGGAVLAFPAGEVARFDARSRCITDPPWSRAIAMLARKSRPVIVPLHLGGNNGFRFHALGFIHPALRSWLLPRELRRHTGARVPVRVGAPLAFERLRHFDDEALAAHLRVVTYLLARATDERVAPRPPYPVAPETDPADCERELAGLERSCRLLDDGEYSIFCAPAAAVPHVADEIGRLRELAGRAANAGSGNARDLGPRDHHGDHPVEHLVVWHRSRREIVAACVITHVGRRHPHAYAGSRFRLRDAFFALTGPMLEMARPFVRVERQATITPLRSMWKGVGAVLARRPRHRLLVGMDVAAGLREPSRELLVEFLRGQHADRLLGMFAKPRAPVTRAPLTRSLAAEVAMLGHLDALCALIDDLEPSGRNIPPMLRATLDLGARLVACDGAECLFVIDLRNSDPRALRRYLPTLP